MTPGNDRRTIVTFAIIAFLILGMACVNFTNLATARASQRAREVALRKVLGANRQQLMTQFLAESVLIAGIAMLLALALVELLLPMLAGIPRCRLDDALFRRGGHAAADPSACAARGGAAGGIYPAFYLSRFQPAQVLKANKSSAEAAGSGRLRNALVIGQFAVSIGLIICTAVVYAQTVYARTVDPGYRRDGLIQVENLGRRQLLERSDAIAAEMRRVPGVVSVGRSGHRRRHQQQQQHRRAGARSATEPVEHRHLWRRSRILRDDGDPAGRRPAVRQEPAGRPLNLPFPRLRRGGAGAGRARRQHRDQRAGGAADGLRRIRPRRSAGRSGVAFVHPENGGIVPTRIIGVVRDSRFRSIREPIDPIMFSWLPSNAGTLLIRHDGTRSAWRARPCRADLAAARSRRAVRRRVQRGPDRRALQRRGGAGQGVRRLRPARGNRRLPRPVRPRRLHRREANQGDRHPQGARRADAGHRAAARLAILQAGDHRESDRLAGRLVGDARMAERRSMPASISARRPSCSPACSPLRSRSAPSPATPSRWRGRNPILALRYE